MEYLDNLNTSWRKTSTALYKKPVDSKILGSVEVDITDLENYVNRKRKEGLKITLTHIITLAVGRCIKKDIPELNAFVRRGDVVPRKSIDAMVAVLLKIGQMGTVKIKNADSITLSEMSDIMAEEIKNTRGGNEYLATGNKDFMSKVPWPFRNWLFSLVRIIYINWGISLPFLNLREDTFGSYMISNIGTLGLDVGYPALFPISNIPLVLIMGGISKKPYVVNDEIVIRRVMTLSVALDHRVVDAVHGGELFRSMKFLLKHPEALESKPEWAV